MGSSVGLCSPAAKGARKQTEVDRHPAVTAVRRETRNSNNSCQQLFLFAFARGDLGNQAANAFAADCVSASFVPA